MKKKLNVIRKYAEQNKAKKVEKKKCLSAIEAKKVVLNQSGGGPWPPWATPRPATVRTFKLPSPILCQKLSVMMPLIFADFPTGCS